MASLMEARLRRLTARFNPTSSPEGLLAAMAEQAAREFDLEPEAVLEEARRILHEMGTMSASEFAEAQGLDPGEVQREADVLLACMTAQGQADAVVIPH